MEIEARIIIEMMGRPADYLLNTINQLLLLLDKEPDVKVIEKKVHEAKKVVGDKMAQDLFSTFAEVTIKTEMGKIFFVVSKYMPSHIEILSPENIRISNTDFSNLLTEFAARLHRYDEIAKGALVRNQILENQLRKFKPVVPMPAATPVVNQTVQKKDKRVAKKATAKKKRI